MLKSHACVRALLLQVRRVLDQIRGRSYEEAIMILEYMPYKVRLRSVNCAAWARAAWQGVCWCGMPPGMWNCCSCAAAAQPQRPTSADNVQQHNVQRHGRQHLQPIHMCSSTVLQMRNSQAARATRATAWHCSQLGQRWDGTFPPQLFRYAHEDAAAGWLCSLCCGQPTCPHPWGHADRH